MSKKIYFLVTYFSMLISFGNLIAKVDSSNLLNLLDSVQPGGVTAKSSTVTSAKEVALDSVLDNVLKMQNNPDYQAALKILSDDAIKNSFHQDLIDIQLFFLEYSTQILQPSTNKKPISLTDLLQKMKTASTQSSGTGQLSNLVDLLKIQSKSSTESSGTVQLSNLVDLVQSKSKSTTVGVQKQKINLEQFLNTSAAPMNAKKASNNLLNLLPSGQQS